VTAPPTHDDHDGLDLDCPRCRAIRGRRAVLLTRALHAPEGLTPYEFTKGLSKADSLAFWTDARALGLIRVGKSKRSAPMYALPSYEVPRVRR
jgi:hypothetical protein